MANLKKCKGDGCPVKESCWRYVADDGPKQEYFADTPGYYGEEHAGLFGAQADWNCEYRIEVKDLF
ncbi:MAG TPA: hypothetical protein VKP88_07545 [Candidatus Paceibacterota bacterium]|nr:hypothetical protein [Candidatus Paceibacterota bacterium]